MNIDVREHDTTQDARRDLGRRGVTVTGYAYAWNAGRNAYDVAPEVDTDWMLTLSQRPNAVGPRKRSRQAWPMRTRDAQRRPGTRVTANGANDFIAAFEAQRVRPHLTNARTIGEWLAQR